MEKSRARFVASRYERSETRPQTSERVAERYVYVHDSRARRDNQARASSIVVVTRDETAGADYRRDQMTVAFHVTPLRYARAFFRRDPRRSSQVIARRIASYREIREHSGNRCIYARLSRDDSPQWLAVPRTELENA